MSDAFIQQGLSLLLALALVLLTGFFVAAEFALVKIRATRVEELVARNVFGARKAREALQNLGGYISATKFGVMVCTLVLGNVGEPAIDHLLEPLFHSLPASTRRVAGSVTALALVTVVEFVLGELAPTTLAIRSAERILLSVIYPLDLFYRLFKGPIAAMTWVAMLVLRPFGVRSAAEHGGEVHTEEELRLILEASHEGGAIRKSELNLVNQIFDLAHRQVKEVMVPRPDVVFLDAGKSLAENLAYADLTGFSRYPLRDGSPDNIIGLVHAKDLLRLRGQALPDDASVLREIATRREVISVPETKPVEELLRDLQRQRQRMAVVIDEYGGTAGIITLEDIVEEIVGDLQDEFDRTSPELEPAGKDCWRVDGRMSLDKLARQLDFTGPAEEPEVDTVGGWVLASLSGPARIGLSVPFGEATFTVTEMAGRRIRRVRVCIPEKPSFETAPVAPHDS